MGVLRCYVEKRAGFDPEARSLLGEMRHLLGLKGLEEIRIFKRYDVEGLDAAGYQKARSTVFSEPQVDEIYDEALPELEKAALLGVEALPGQFDQRADSAAQCLQLLLGGARPLVRCATIYALKGEVSAAELEKAEGYLINPVESRRATAEKPETLRRSYPEPADVAALEGFLALDEAGLTGLLGDMGLAMDLEDLKFLQGYFRNEEKRDPTVTELRVVDTYWSDHCRHTTFSTHLDSVKILDPAAQRAYETYLALREEVYGAEKAALRPKTLMDMATIAAKALKKRGALANLDESEEINACSIHVTATVDGAEQDWLLMFKNETHNHPTEIEPFGGAATCIGGCIRDPLSGRAYVYQAMRLTGCGDPRTPLEETPAGKLPQRKLCQTAAAGYSSYGNQIGLATGLVDELYHPGYVAKHLEVGAVVGAAPAENVRRERPQPGDVVILLGGRTGRDGIGGATGSSKSHDLKSLNTMASEVQKGNAPEERKLQRLFRNGEVTRLIKRCNDFGAGGVSVAIGELADGLEINLDAVRKKYDGLDGTELAISESQERMAVVVAAEDADKLIAAAEKENLEAYPVAVVTQSPRMVMRWRGKTIANLSRAFLDTNGAVKHASAEIPEKTGELYKNKHKNLLEMASSLDCASRRGLAERFDSTIGASSVLMPYGGKHQRTPAQVMAALLPVGAGRDTEDCSVMSWGFQPDAMSADTYRGAYDAVVLSLAKLVAAGCDYEKAYLTFQEYFEKLRQEPLRWGKPLGALLGGLQAQMDFSAAAIGGKDSMSGSFLDLDVPPTLISFAVAPAKAGEVLSGEFKAAGNSIYLFRNVENSPEETRKMWKTFHALARAGRIKAAWAVEHGIAEGVMKMAFGNGIGATLEGDWDWFKPMPGAILAEVEGKLENGAGGDLTALLGVTTAENVITLPGDSACVEELLRANEGTLEDIYPTRTDCSQDAPEISWPGGSPLVATAKFARPRAVIPVFPGTNCELDTAAACERAGIAPEVLVIRNGSGEALADSAAALERAIRQSQMVILPGGFSGGDEPDGSAKFICSLFRSAGVKEAVTELLQRRDGLMLGICNGFQALVKLGLVPYGEIRDMDENCATLSFNDIGRHQSRYAYTRVASVKSPWMAKSRVGEIHAVPISHGEGKFLAPEGLLKTLADNGQIATQYVNAQGQVSRGIDACPNGSAWAVEGIFSPDGRVLGKMGHSERTGRYIGKNIVGNKYQPIFESGAAYFK